MKFKLSSCSPVAKLAYSLGLGVDYLMEKGDTGLIPFKRYDFSLVAFVDLAWLLLITLYKKIKTRDSKSNVYPLK